MSGFAVEDKRLLQIFLPDVKGSFEIYEVYAKASGELTCNCATHEKRNSCKHTRFIQARIDANKGRYIPEILRSATPEETELAKTSNQEYNQFLRRYGKIEVY